MDVSRQAVIVVFSPARFSSTRGLTLARGFTLIEVLVALSITAIGLLGLAALQLQGLRGTHEASLRTQAVTLASEVSEALHGYRAHDAAAALPDADLDAWQARVAQILPLGEGRIAADATATTITVLWTAHDSSEQIQLSVAP